VIISPRLSTWTVVTAALLTSVGLVVGSGAVQVPWLAEPGPPSLPNFALAAAVAGLGQVPRLWAKGGRIALVWGEAAIIVLCCLLPVAWIPAALLVGVGGAHTMLAAVDSRPARRVAPGVAALTIAGFAAAVVVHAIAPTVGVSLDPRMALALGAGAATYFGLTVLIAAATAVSRCGGSFGAHAREVSSTKLLMVIGNVVVGLLIVALRRTDHGVWLVLIPPVVWLLHQAYAYRLRGDTEHSTWEAFSEAMRQLNRLDERHAAEAGIQAALRLFQARRVEIVVHSPGAPDREYRGEAAPAQPGAEPGSAPDAAAGAAAGAAVGAAQSRPPLVHPLIVGGSRVGELRLYRTGRGLGSGRDRYMFAAYGDALAAALHDAATHSELQAITRRSTHDAVRDPLTGVTNRAALLNQGNAALRQLPAGAPVALLLLDINRFKEVNNALGHAAGDELLRITANRLGADGRAGEQLARLGGDEFAVLITLAPAAVPTQRPAALPTGGPTATLPTGPTGGPAGGSRAADATRSAYAMSRAGRLAEVVAEPVDVAGVQLSVEVSVGVVTATAGAVDMTELLRRADIAMYQAKRAGQVVSRYDAIRDVASTDRLALLAEMREALAGGDQIHLLVQPAVRLLDGVVIGVEVLARWEHPRRGSLLPADFLPAVELGDLIGPFTRYVLGGALTVMAAWRAQGVDVPWAVNLSARGLLDPALPGDVRALLDRHAIPPHRLVLEITESVVVADLPVIDEVLNGLRTVGVQLSVDDFGTGFSSLTFLTRVPVDEVKIDRAFVAAMVDSPEAAAIVRTIVELGRELDLRVVAEGVETAEQRDALIALRCAAAQGYLFFRPMLPAKAVAAVRAARPTNVRRLRADDAG